MSASSITDFKKLSRTISIVENELPDYEQLLEALKPNAIPVIGITGPPGAGKSTLLNALIGNLLDDGKKIGLVLIDPSSPFNLGALLGDRLRMSQYFTHPHLFIRSVATRGSLGGLCDKIIEITEVMKAYPFDYIFIETVGVGQSEVEIAGLADTTVVLLVPEAGDSIQTMKSGLMEIADVFVLNKFDRPESESLYHSLSLQLHLSGRDDIPVIKTVASEAKGLEELLLFIKNENISASHNRRKEILLTNKALQIIQKRRMKDFSLKDLQSAIAKKMFQPNFHFFKLIKRFS